MRFRRALALLAIFVCLASPCSAALRAGAAVIDVTPLKFPVIINGGMEERLAEKVNDPVFARAIVLDDGTTKLAIVVVDSCMLPRELLDPVKDQAAKTTGIPASRILISATHTHSAPAAMGCLGSDADAEYVKFLPGKLVEAIEKANAKLIAARLGHAVIDVPEYTANRRWIRRPDRVLNDPFGDPTVRANMHPGFNSPDAIGPAGPVDPGLSVLSIQSDDGKPLALLANYSMHYFNSPAISADYFGLFCRRIAQLMGTRDASEGGDFVAIMSQGTSGDTWLADYSKPQRTVTTKIDEYTDQVAHKALVAYQAIQYKADVTLAMAEATLKLNRRVPSPQRLEWARKTVKEFEGAKPKTRPHIYAREAIFLHEDPVREMKLQALRIGDLGIIATPNEVYALTGLKLKAMSPFPKTFNISLANGSEGYIPPPEQHHLGGYTTWPARTAALEVDAEPKIVESVAKLLETVAGNPRRTPSEPETPYSRAVLASKPIFYWRLGDMAGPHPNESVRGALAPGKFEPGVAFYLDGPAGAGMAVAGQINRAIHLAGGRIRTTHTPNWRTIELWFWSGLGNEARKEPALLFSYGRDGQPGAATDSAGIDESGRIFFHRPTFDVQKKIVGKTMIQPRAWYHMAVVIDKEAKLYLNGKPEAVGPFVPGWLSNEETLSIGGGLGPANRFEGRIDEVATYGEPLPADVIAAHYAAASASALPLPPGEGRGEGVRDKGDAPAALQRDSHPLSPDEALKKFHLKEGFQIELVASEPLVVDPVAIDWGADGKLWVVEMRDYPYGLDGKMKPGGRIKFLEDTDSDGKYDKSTLFLDGVNMPNGILVWRKGVLVTSAPEILYAEDTDGDGKADKREVLFTGFKEGNPQLRINGLRWGIDGWVYCANGKSGGSVASVKTGEKLELGSRDIRINPDTGAMQALAGSSQFGRNPDDWGNWFGCDNSHPLFHFILEDYYTKRNPHVAPPDPALQLMTPANPRVFSKSKTQKRYHSFYHETTFTAACSANIYRDKLLFDDGKTHMFVCEPVHNLVHHQGLTPSGVSFVSRRAADEQDREFLASEDPWFRPVMNRTGPDGALWVVDMYRYMIEHPDWLPQVGQDELRKFFRDGDDKGRIYRIYPKGKRPGIITRFDTRPQQLANQLESTNGWLRDAALMRLSWLEDHEVPIASLRSLLQARSPLARLAALSALAMRSPASIPVTVFADDHPAVRVQALRTAERLLRTNSLIVSHLAKLTDDPSEAVRLQLALSIGEYGEHDAGPILGRLGTKDGEHPYITAAVLSSAVKHHAAIAEAYETGTKATKDPMLRGLITTAAASNNRPILARLLEHVLSPRRHGYDADQLETYGMFAEFLSSRRIPLALVPDQAPDELSRILGRVPELMDAARRSAGDPYRSDEQRIAAIHLLGRDVMGRADAVGRLNSLLKTQNPSAVQIAAVKTLSRIGDDATPALLMRNWGEKSPALRFASIDALISREAWALALLRELEAGNIPKVDVDLSRRQRLLRHQSGRIKELAGKIFGDQFDPSRQKVVEELRGSLAIAGDAKRGQKVFRENCLTCHRINDEGFELGPDLRSVRTWTSEALLTAIIDPDRQAEPRYVGYNATLTSGETVTGLVMSETANSIVVRRIDGQDQTILRSTLRSLSSTNRSFMPIGFESALSERDLADLFRFLREGIDGGG